MSALGNSEGKFVLGPCQFSSPPKKKLKLFKPIQFSSSSRRWEIVRCLPDDSVPKEIRYFPDDSVTKEIRYLPDELVFEHIMILPDELVTEILEWLPVKSILRFRCVSKRWSALFKNPTFIRNHSLKQGRAKCASGTLLLLRRRVPPPLFNNSRLSLGELVDILSFHDLDSPERKARPSLHISDYLQLLKEGDTLSQNNALRLLGPINGIICLKYTLRRYILCNPIMREYKPLPPLLCDSPNKDYYPHNEADGFGVSYSSSTSTSHLEEEDNFKIIVMHRFFHLQQAMPPLPFVYVHLYTWNTNSWRQLGDAPAFPVMPYPLNSVFFNGACHWCGGSYAADNKDNKVILSFNMTYEVFLLLELPKCLQKANVCYPHPVVLNNCLGVVQYNNWESMSVPFVIWVMKEYGVRESWTKQFVISPQPFRTTLLPWKNDTMLLLQRRRLPSQRGTGNTGNVFDRKFRDQLTSVDLHTGKMRKFQVFGAECTLHGLIYQESLVTLN